MWCLAARYSERLGERLNPDGVAESLDVFDLARGERLLTAQLGKQQRLRADRIDQGPAVLAFDLDGDFHYCSSLIDARARARQSSFMAIPAAS